ncbi:AbrB/MazE/SpoVT family DNA-binding domain-containing protein [Candidatus Thioglobus sp.]|uniref:AbrB/MazE/SpoVT family DNA-binding domain-containing protein n=1 Tax=Candidatus Thioglobus sp. TaxID=2026721 RepID=UPI003D0CEAF5
MQIESKVQKWGNGLALRMSGALRTVPNFKEGDLLTITINENGFSAIKPTQRKFTEQELLLDITASNAHVDLVPKLLNSEYE